MIVEVTGRIFHMHIPVDTEDGAESLVADVAMEPSMGLLMISAGGVAVAGSWPERDEWGQSTFEEFLCSRTPSWIVSKMLGQDALIFDEDRTREALLETCGTEHEATIAKLLDRVDSHGEIQDSGAEFADTLDDVLEEPCDGFIFMETTGFAKFLIEGVLPNLLERIAPPEVVTNQTNLKLC